jgi:WS/DGAT/MGAT family acyltransferase
MHIGGVAVFEGPAPTYGELREHLCERLQLLPRFGQKLAQAPLGLSRPWWVHDPHFNLDHHLRPIALTDPGDADQLRSLAARLFSERLDRDTPLWAMCFVEGLEHGRFALIVKVHHALADGMSGVDLASVIMDTAPQSAPVRGAGVPSERKRAPSRAELAVRSLASSMRAPVRLAECSAAAVLHPRQVSRTLAQVAVAMGWFGRELLDAAPSVPLNGEIGPDRRYEHRELEFAQVDGVKHHYEATVNDVVLALATGALRRWLLERGVPTDGLELRALVPVDLRQEHERGLLGNRVALLRVALPVYAAQPEQQLLLIREQMRKLKRSGQVRAAQRLIGLSEFAPTTILAQAAGLGFSARLFNLVITNVPGPRTPLYLLGRELESIAPIALLLPDHALSLAVLSYNGRLSFGLLGDHDRLYDLELLADGLEDSLGELAPSAAAAR